MDRMPSRTRRPRALVSACLALALLLVPAPALAQGPATPAQLASAREYVRRGWRTLTRSNRDLLNAAIDPKFQASLSARQNVAPRSLRWPVYVARGEDLAAVERRLRAEMPAADFARIELRRLPGRAEEAEPGLLYLPRPYVVPGGRFNEMYGWDSYFIQVGLLRDGETELARDMVENFLYEVEHYGHVLNANRTYYLTRSQPPFLTRMVLGVYERTGDRAWLRRAAPAVGRYYDYWAARGAPHLTPTGLSRYYDSGSGPAPEVVADERDARGRTHYDRVKEFYRANPDREHARFYDRRNDLLTPDFYKGDRSMRESGFDPSNRFGRFGADVTRYNPVCLNSLLYVYERDAARIMRELGREGDARVWERRARARRGLVNRLLWDERDGLYYDYDYVRGEARRYPFVTTFYPLWAGIATRRQAARVVRNLARFFERPGGLQTSAERTGSQWDAPYGWAPMQLVAVEGLRRYGFGAEAERVSVNFLSLVLKEFVEHNTIVEKYDVERRTSALGEGLRFGYTSNEIGFGWTNAAFTELYAQLSPAGRAGVLEPGGVAAPRR